MGLLHLLEQIRTPFWDSFFLTATQLAEQVVVVAVLLVILWCVDKRWGYRLVLTFLCSTFLSQFLKGAFQIPRPWIQDPTLSPVEGAVAGAAGYSFPSGHTQSAGVLYGAVALEGRSLWVRVCGALLVLLVAFSRLYLGVHTPLDVGTSLCLSLVLLVGLRWLFRRFPRRIQRIWGACVAALGALLLLSLAFFAGDESLVRHSVENMTRLLGILAGLAVARYLDERYIRYETGARWYHQILKVVLGLVVAGAGYVAFKLLFVLLPWQNAGLDALRYGLLVVLCAGIYPAAFRFFRPKEEMAGMGKTERGGERDEL